MSGTVPCRPCSANTSAAAASTRSWFTRASSRCSDTAGHLRDRHVQGGREPAEGPVVAAHLEQLDDLPVGQELPGPVEGLVAHPGPRDHFRGEFEDRSVLW